MKRMIDVMSIAASMALGAAGTYMLMDKQKKSKPKVKSAKQS